MRYIYFPQKRMFYHVIYIIGGLDKKKWNVERTFDVKEARGYKKKSAKN